MKGEVLLLQSVLSAGDRLTDTVELLSTSKKTKTKIKIKNKTENKTKNNLNKKSYPPLKSQ